MKTKFADGDSSEHIESCLHCISYQGNKGAFYLAYSFLGSKPHLQCSSHACLLSPALAPQSCCSLLLRKAFGTVPCPFPAGSQSPSACVLLFQVHERLQNLNWVCLWFTYFIPYFTM